MKKLKCCSIVGRRNLSNKWISGGQILSQTVASKIMLVLINIHVTIQRHCFAINDICVAEINEHDTALCINWSVLVVFCEVAIIYPTYM